jgi:hypothetical protein
MLIFITFFKDELKSKILSGEQVNKGSNQTLPNNRSKYGKK